MAASGLLVGIQVGGRPTCNILGIDHHVTVSVVIARAGNCQPEWRQSRRRRGMGLLGVDSGRARAAASQPEAQAGTQAAGRHRD
jgi:hypothetical protein